MVQVIQEVNKIIDDEWISSENLDLSECISFSASYEYSADGEL